MREIQQTYYQIYLNIVKSADVLLTQPTHIKSDTEKKVADVEMFGKYLVDNLSKLESFPSLAKSLFELVRREEMTGYLGIFLIDEAIAMCNEFIHTEDEIMTKVDRIANSSLTIDQSLLNEIRIKTKSWRKMVVRENIPDIKLFLATLRQQIDSLYETLNDKEKLGKALAQSEEERKHLLEMEEARRRGITELELDKEEKRRKAREEFAKSMKTRKKK